MDKNEMILKNKVTNCILCGKATDPDDGEEIYCSGCGSPLINSCSNYNCKEILPSDAAYCKHCGFKSIFLNADLVVSTVHVDLINSDDSNFPF